MDSLVGQWVRWLEQLRLCHRGEMKPGDMVYWKYQREMNLAAEYGILLQQSIDDDDSLSYWQVLFPSQGILTCREIDLMLVDP